MKTLYLAAFLAALVATLFAGIAYFAPFGNTGVDGSIGALLALIGAAASGAGILIVLTANPSGPWRSTLNILTIVAALLTALAAYFLLQFVVMLAMGATVILLVIAIALRLNRRMTP